MDKYVNVWCEIVDKKSKKPYVAFYTIASFFGIYPVKEDVNLDGEWVIKLYVPRFNGNKRTLITNKYLCLMGWFGGELLKLPKTYISTLPVKKLKTRSVLTLFGLIEISRPTSENLIYDHEKLNKLLKMNGI